MSTVTRMSLECEVFPALGCIHVTDIKAPEVLAVLRGIETRAKETARRVRQRMSSVFVYAIS